MLTAKTTNTVSTDRRAEVFAQSDPAGVDNRPGYPGGTISNQAEGEKAEMDYKCSILITTFQRPHLLKWGLYSLARQHIPFPLETIVINDAVEGDGTEEICKEYADRLNIKYIFSGKRNLGENIKWRVPGFAINIGAKQSSGKVIIISCAEMFHINDTIALLTEPVLHNPKSIGIPIGKDDQDGSFLNHLIMNNGHHNVEMLNKYPKLNALLPFLMSVSRQQFDEIGGSDEDFTGIAYDDNDFVDRLLANGCKYIQTEAKTVHLYHPRYVYGKEQHADLLFNKNLYLSRKGIIVRNKGRDWGHI